MVKQNNDEKRALHCQLDKSTYDLLVDFCDKSGQSKTVAIRRAIKAYCENNGAKSNGSGK